MEVHPLKIYLKYIYYSLCSVTGSTVEIMRSEEIEPGIIFFLQYYNHPLCYSRHAWLDVLCSCFLGLSMVQTK